MCITDYRNCTLPFMQLKVVFLLQDETLREVTLTSEAVNKQSITIGSINQSLQSVWIGPFRGLIILLGFHHVVLAELRNLRKEAVSLATHKLSAENSNNFVCIHMRALANVNTNDLVVAKIVKVRIAGSL